MIIHVTKLKDGFSVRVEWTDRYYEAKSLEEVEEILRREFKENDAPV